MQYIKVTDQQTSDFFQFDNSRALECLLSDIEGFEDSVAINSIEDVASRIGATAVNSKSGRRLTSWVARFMCDVLDKRRELQLALRRTGFLKLIEFETLDGLELRFEAYFDKLKAPYTSRTGSPMLIQFTAPDPRFYSQTLHDQSIARNTTGVIANAGTEISHPVMRIHGPLTSGTITNLNNDLEIQITQTLLLGEYLEIDMLNQTVELDDGTSVYSAIDGTPEFIFLLPGNNTVQFADTGGGVGTSLQVLWRDAYNGV